MFVMPACFNSGDTIYFPFDAYDSSGASVTITNFAVTDIECYKNGSTTQRTSDNGYTLLDTYGIDFDGTVGLHGFSIDTSDNSDAGFWADGAQYWVNINSITVDGQTVRFTYYLALGYSLRPTTAGRKLDVSSGGEAGVDWANVGSPTTTVTLSGTTVKTATDVETDTQDIQSRLPAALVSGKMDSDATAISGDTAAADNLEKQFDGTGYGQVLQRTTIATLASQTSFTLTEGSSDNDAYNDCIIVIEDASTAAQKAVAVVDDYTGSTKTVTLRTDPAVFTMATTDIVTIIADRALKPTVMNRTLDVASTGEAGLDFNNVVSSGLITLHSLAITGGTTFSSTTTPGLTISSTASGGTAGLQVTSSGTGIGALFQGGSSGGVGINIFGGTASVYGLQICGAGGPGTGKGVRTTTVVVDDTMTANITGNITGNLSGSIGSVSSGGITAASIATDAIDADALAADAIAEINATVDTALSDIQLDHLIQVADPGSIVANSSLWAKLHSKSATPAYSSYDNTTDSLEAVRDKEIDIETDTQDIQSRLPAALVSGRMDSNMQAAANNVITSSVLAADCIGASQIAANAIGASEIADGAIDRATFAADTGLQTVRSNTAQAGAAGTITLDASASSTDDYYNDTWVYITANTGVGQIRRISDYVGSTKVATIEPNWTTNPDNTSTFAIKAFGRVDVGSWLGTTPNSLQSGRVDCYVGTFAAGAITAASIADGAIDRATFAADTGLQTIRSSTAQTGSAGTITLDASASSTDDYYNDAWVYITGGTGAGQCRRVSDYVGSTKVATIEPNWATNPDSSSTFAVVPFGRVDIGSWVGSTPNALSSGNPTVQLANVSHGGASAAFQVNTLTVTSNSMAWNPSWDAEVQSECDDALTANSSIVAIKAKTDSLTFTVAGHVDANIQRCNDVLVTGNGQSGNYWGPG